MRRLLGMVFAFGLGLAAMALAFNFHFVKTDSDWFIVKKQEVRFGDFYADVREWDGSEWKEHPELQDSLIQAGHEDLIPQPESANVIDLLNGRSFRRVGNAPRNGFSSRR